MFITNEFLLFIFEHLSSKTPSVAYFINIYPNLLTMQLFVFIVIIDLYYIKYTIF